jgi:hypothetical protein
MKSVLLAATAVFALSMGSTHAAGLSAPLTVTVTSSSGSGTGALPGSILPPGSWTVIDDQEMNGSVSSPWEALNGYIDGNAYAGTNSSTAYFATCSGSGPSFSGTCLYTAPTTAACEAQGWGGPGSGPACSAGYQRQSPSPASIGASLYLQVNGIFGGSWDSFWIAGQDGSTCSTSYATASELDIPEYNATNFWSTILYQGYSPTCAAGGVSPYKDYWWSQAGSLNCNVNGGNCQNCPSGINCNPANAHIVGTYWGANSPSGGMDYYFDGYHATGFPGVPGIYSGSRMLLDNSTSFYSYPMQIRWVRIYKCVSGC